MGPGVDQAPGPGAHGPAYAILCDVQHSNHLRDRSGIRTCGGSCLGVTKVSLSREGHCGGQAGSIGP